jgi:Flp pilus assembly protein TadD
LSLICVLAAVTYANSVQCGFAFDDAAAVVKNPDVDPASPVSLLLVHDFWGQDITSPRSHKSFRPLTVLSFRLNRLFGEGRRNSTAELTNTPDSLARGFHVTNVVLHTCVSLLVYCLAVVAFRADDLEALAAAGLFAAHPIHTEAVTGIVGRADVLCCAFCISAFLLFVAATAVKRAFVRWLALCACHVCIALASLSKEIGVTVAGPILVYDLLYVANLVPPLRTIWKCIRSPRKRGSVLLDYFTSSRLRAFAVRQFSIALTVVLLLVHRKAVTVSFKVSGHIRSLENPLMKLTGLPFVYSLGMLHTKYLQQLVFPIVLSADWSYNAIPLVYELVDIRNLISLLVYLSFFVACAACAWRLQEGRFFLVCLAWLVTTFLPSSNIFFFVGTMVGERLLYVPSVGFCLIVARILHRGINRGTALRTVCVTLGVSLVLGYAYRAHVRNPDWMGNETLFAKTVQTVPNSAKAQMMWAEELQIHGRWAESIPFLKRALEIEPEYCDVHHALGASLYQLGDFGTGVALLHKGLDCLPSRVSAATNLNAIYNLILQANPNNMSAILGWADVLAKINRQREASEYFISISSMHRDAKDMAAAISLAQKAVELTPMFCEAQYWLGVLLVEIGRPELAVDHLEASSFQTNCSTTFVSALDKLVGVLNDLHPKGLAPIDPRWVSIVMRAQGVVQSLKT